MIDRDHYVEILAQALWLRHYGETRFLAEWLDWASAHNSEADALRSKANDMLAVHEGMPKDQPGSRTTHHSSLSWLY